MTNLSPRRKQRAGFRFPNFLLAERGRAVAEKRRFLLTFRTNSARCLRRRIFARQASLIRFRAPRCSLFRMTRDAGGSLFRAWLSLLKCPRLEKVRKEHPYSETDCVDAAASRHFAAHSHTPHFNFHWTTAYGILRHCGVSSDQTSWERRSNLWIGWRIYKTDTLRDSGM